MAKRRDLPLDLPLALRVGIYPGELEHGGGTRDDDFRRSGKEQRRHAL
jgi:hypothetical protein